MQHTTSAHCHKAGNEPVGNHRVSAGQTRVTRRGLLPRLGFGLGMGAALYGCGHPPAPSEPLNACDIFANRRAWYDSVLDAKDRWGAPPHVLMAIIYQESAFDADARPDRKKFLWVLPGGRPSSAFGYAQATDPTWQKYKQDTGRAGADRDSFRAAADFVGWYMRQSHRMCRIPMDDAYAQYLAYHEGWSGYNAGSFRRKRALRGTAKRVASLAARYDAQLDRCRRRLKRRLFFVF